MLIPSMTDPTMTPPGKHFMSVFVQYVPQVKSQDWTVEQCSLRPDRGQPDRVRAGLRN
jgi:phytoene dehydrogenase-like protein